MITTYDPLHIEFIKAVEYANRSLAPGARIPSVPTSAAALDAFLTSDAFRDRLTHALVEVEESKLCGDCLSDTCGVHDEMPEGSVGCGDAAEIADWMRPKRQR